MPDSRPCKLCGAPIFFGTTAAGKAMPLDAKPEKRAIVSRVVSPEGEHLQASLFDTYLPHWASCPKADSFRKPKEKPNDVKQRKTPRE